jgi:hypothetical protein
MDTTNTQKQNIPSGSLPGKGSTPSLGEKLVALQRRQRAIHNVKVGIVWVVLVSLLIGGLMMIRIDPRYMLDHYNVILQGAGATIGVSLASIAIATVLALLGSIARLSSN